MASQPSLQTLLNQATDPNNLDDRWDCIQDFCQLVNQETDGPQVAVRLLSHKIQSPQEKEALQALTVLEACMNNCGKKFHGEVAKFRFLNELIKVLTPKYFGSWTPQKVKDRVTEVLYGWTLWLKDEAKIQEAYSMLKKQGIVKEDPKVSNKIIMAPPPQRSTQSVFDQEKATLLSRLLKSACPEDLETANRLIKTTVKEEQEKAEKASKLEYTLKEVESSTKELRDLLERQAISGTILELSDDVMPLYERCDRLKPTLFRLASDTVDDDEALTHILAANDELTLVLSAYKDQLLRREGGTSGEQTEPRASTPPGQVKSYHLIDFSALHSPKSPGRTNSPRSFNSSLATFSSVLDSELGLSEQEFESQVLRPTRESPRSYYEELIQLHDGADHTENAEQNAVPRAPGCGGGTTSSLDWANVGSQLQNNPFTGSESPLKLQEEPSSNILGFPAKSEETSSPQQILEKLYVPVETIKSSHVEPLTLFDHAGVHVSLHFATDSAALAHPDAAVVVISTVNTSALRVSDHAFQVAVPKTMSVKVQPASGTHLPAYNPVLPPPAISQVLLLANPHKRPVRLRYKLTLQHGDRQLRETRDIDNFPDWTTLTGC
ncbi:ADP-ribosylation factor-binding protein GGA2-like [Nelusetta ayraudi]|uniref:ADP-ribosylation factor-binding protein GGA2-like n=1 Tax=Nelusetta ayraudi TaxID=303726 RepID=UPI003F72CBFE